MKRFRFSLQAVQTIRQRQERLALQHYTDSANARRAAEEQLRVARNDVSAAWAASREQLTSTTLSADAIAQMRNFCRLREERERQCEAQLREAAKLLEAAWKKLVTARQRREAVEKFYQRQRRRYDRDCERESEKTLDEIAHRRPLAMPAWSLTALEGPGLS
jgi:flagellar export protein FliJ